MPKQYLSRFKDCAECAKAAKRTTALAHILKKGRVARQSDPSLFKAAKNKAILRVPANWQLWIFGQ